MEIDETTANYYIDEMVTVLQDGQELVHRTDAQQAVLNLEEVSYSHTMLIFIYQK